MRQVRKWPWTFGTVLSKDPLKWKTGSVYRFCIFILAADAPLLAKDRLLQAPNVHELRGERALV